MFRETYLYIKTGKSENIEERMSLLRRMIVDLKNLENKSRCPLCNQVIDKNDVSETMKKFNDLLPEIEKEIIEFNKKRNAFFKKQREIEKKEKEEFDKKVDEYLTHNIRGIIVKDEIKKCIRNYFKIEYKFPKIREKEKELWNAGVLKVLYELDKDDCEYEDLIIK